MAHQCRCRCGGHADGSPGAPLHRVPCFRNIPDRQYLYLMHSQQCSCWQLLTHTPLLRSGAHEMFSSLQVSEKAEKSSLPHCAMCPAFKPCCQCPHHAKWSALLMLTGTYCCWTKGLRKNFRHNCVSDHVCNSHHCPAVSHDKSKPACDSKLVWLRPITGNASKAHGSC